MLPTTQFHGMLLAQPAPTHPCPSLFNMSITITEPMQGPSPCLHHCCFSSLYSCCNRRLRSASAAWPSTLSRRASRALLLPLPLPPLDWKDRERPHLLPNAAPALPGRKVRDRLATGAVAVPPPVPLPAPGLMPPPGTHARLSCPDAPGGEPPLPRVLLRVR